MASGFDGLADLFMSHKTDEQAPWQKMLAGMGFLPGSSPNSYVVGSPTNTGPQIPTAAGSNIPGK
jgi:hypothetical protein